MSDTVLITGISGFIAKHVAHECLSAGYAVRGTVRDMARAASVTESLKAAGAPTERLSFVVADLESDPGWAEAAQGCHYVQHIASPFPLTQPKRRDALVPAARDGALRVLKAATEAERIVLTSSIAAIMYRPQRPRQITVTAADWTDTRWPSITPYILSKTLAEHAAWDFMERQDATSRLVCINPGLVLGPALDAQSGTSLEVISLLLKGAYPAVPPVSFPIVDVRDVARLHVRALTAPVGGERLIAAADTLSMAEMARGLKAALPDHTRKTPTGELPIGLVKILSRFDPALATLKADFGVRVTADATETTRLTGVRFRPAHEALIAAARSLLGLTPTQP